MDVLLVVGVAILLIVMFLPRQEISPVQQSAACIARDWDEDYSYLYYLNRKGELVYDSEFCRGCIENEAERLRRKGFTVTEVVLGTKYSGDL